MGSMHDLLSAKIPNPDDIFLFPKLLFPIGYMDAICFRFVQIEFSRCQHLNQRCFPNGPSSNKNQFTFPERLGLSRTRFINTPKIFKNSIFSIFLEFHLVTISYLPKHEAQTKPNSITASLFLGTFTVIQVATVFKCSTQYSTYSSPTVQLLK